MKEIGNRAHPALRARLEALGPEQPETGALLARLRELTGEDMGFAAAHLREGFSTWAQHGGPVETPAEGTPG